MWSAENDEILIDFVENNEALFNVKTRKIQLSKIFGMNSGLILKDQVRPCILSVNNNMFCGASCTHRQSDIQYLRVLMMYMHTFNKSVH